MRRSSLPALAVVALLAVGCSSAPSNPTTQADTKPTDTRPTPPHAATGGCHPGCFPAGTLVETPGGPRAIETIRKGETVTLIAADGTATSGRAVELFDTCNRLVEVRTGTNVLLTTDSQPLCLCDGRVRQAGELEAGDAIWRWVDGVRKAVRVTAVTPTERHAPVYNLVVGDGAVFVANGVLARGKPPE